MTIPELIARQNRMNLTNVKLAERLGIAAETYSRYRTGHLPLPPDLDERLSVVEQAHQAMHVAKDAPRQLPPRYTLELVPLTGADDWGNPLIARGTPYWEYGCGFLHRRTRAAKHYNDGYDGIFIPPSWVGLDLPGADATPYAPK